MTKVAGQISKKLRVCFDGGTNGLMGSRSLSWLDDFAKWPPQMKWRMKNLRWTHCLGNWLER